jgi:hypothetical protein
MKETKCCHWLVVDWLMELLGVDVERKQMGR